MNWDMISAVGQMLGAVGVIISIVYLAAQIRNQNKESRRSAMNVLTTHWSDLNKSLVDNPDFAALWLRALQSFDQLDGTSKLRFGAHLGRFLRFADSPLSRRLRRNARQAIMARI
jgi:heme/copper-type cytochrome/quinol oxidase subunit 1